MIQNPAQQQHIEWLRGQLEQRKQALAEAEARIARLKTELAYFKDSLSQFNIEHLEQDANTVTIASNIEDESPEVHAPQQRSPKEMLRSEFSGKTLGDVAEFVLRSCGEAVNADDIAKLVFDTNSSDEYLRARNSLSTELRRGAKEERWKQVGRGLFVIHNNKTRLEAEPQAKALTLS